MMDYMNEIKPYNIRRALPEPENAALLVVDMQVYFSAIAEPILENALSLIDASRRKGMEIIFTRHGHIDPERDGGMLGTWWRDLIHYGTPEWQLIPKIRENASRDILDKKRYSAFFETGLDERLKRNKIKDLIICGVLTNCCCETTARDAFVRDYRVFFVADATGAANKELHVSSLRNLAYGFAYIVTKDQLINCIENQG